MDGVVGLITPDEAEAQHLVEDGARMDVAPDLEDEVLEARPVALGAGQGRGRAGGVAEARVGLPERHHPRDRAHDRWRLGRRAIAMGTDVAPLKPGQKADPAVGHALARDTEMAQVRHVSGPGRPARGLRRPAPGSRS